MRCRVIGVNRQMLANAFGYGPVGNNFIQTRRVNDQHSATAREAHRVPPTRLHF
jgi:hypothetical protein